MRKPVKTLAQLVQLLPHGNNITYYQEIQGKMYDLNIVYLYDMTLLEITKMINEERLFFDDGM